MSLLTIFFLRTFHRFQLSLNVWRMYVLFTTLGSASNGSEHANMITYKGAVANSTLENICSIDWFYVKQEMTLQWG